jgi:hypothetical protein
MRYIPRDGGSGRCVRCVAVCRFVRRQQRVGSGASSRPESNSEDADDDRKHCRAADWASTYHAMTNYHVRETNFLLRGLQDSPGKLVVAGAAIDAATFTAWNTWVAPRHPKVASAGCGPWPASGPISSSITSATSNGRCAALP